MSEITELEFANILEVEGVLARGWGNAPKIVMQDRRLSPCAKCIYCYFASYAGGGSTAFPSVKKILFDLNINKRTYRKYYEQLEQYGYISSHQFKSKDGKFGKNIYKLHSNPTVVQNLNHGTEVQNTVVQNLPHGKKCTTNINRNTSNINNNKNNILTSGLAIPSDFYYDWMSELEDEEEIKKDYQSQADSL